jgi:hypothetical protein
MFHPGIHGAPPPSNMIIHLKLQINYFGFAGKFHFQLESRLLNFLGADADSSTIR